MTRDVGDVCSVDVRAPGGCFVDARRPGIRDIYSVDARMSGMSAPPTHGRRGRL